MLGLDNVGEHGSLTICSGAGAIDSWYGSLSFIKPRLSLKGSFTSSFSLITRLAVNISDHLKNLSIILKTWLITLF